MTGTTGHDDGLRPRPTAPHTGPAESRPERPGSTGWESAGHDAAQVEPQAPTTESATPAPAGDSPSVDASDTRTSPRRRRGPRPFTLIVLPSLVMIPGVLAFLALNGGLGTTPPQAPGPGQAAVSNADGSYVPWLRKATADCTGVTPALLAAPQGAQVSAAREGLVKFAGMTSAYGNRVVIDHGTIDGKRLETAYSHLSAFQVTTGQSVTTGDPVGLVGSTGLSTGPHLHFEVFFHGQYMDPVAWLNSGG